MGSKNTASWQVINTTRLDFEATPSYRFFGRMSSWGILLACCALALAAFWTAMLLRQTWLQHKSNEQTQQQRQSLHRQLSDHQTAQKRSLNISPDQSRLNEDQRRGLNLAIRQLNTPWANILMQIEQATPTGIALIQIEPEGKQGIKIQAESKSLDALLGYAASLQQRGVFGNLTYTKHETNEQDPNKPVRLSFQLGWQGIATEKSENQSRNSATTGESIEVRP